MTHRWKPRRCHPIEATALGQGIAKTIILPTYASITRSSSPSRTQPLPGCQIGAALARRPMPAIVELTTRKLCGIAASTDDQGHIYAIEQFEVA
jgi:hypothetical protein